MNLHRVCHLAYPYPNQMNILSIFYKIAFSLATMCPWFLAYVLTTPLLEHSDFPIRILVAAFVIVVTVAITAMLLKISYKFLLRDTVTIYKNSFVTFDNAFACKMCMLMIACGLAIAKVHVSIFIIITILLMITLITTQTWVYNMVLCVFGYQFYIVEWRNARRLLIISKTDIRYIMDDAELYLRRVTDFVYLMKHS